MREFYYMVMAYQVGDRENLKSIYDLRNIKNIKKHYKITLNNIESLNINCLNGNKYEK